jgi:hypothetical protein
MDLGRVAKGVATGGLTEAPGLLKGLFGGGGGTTSQELMMTPEQRAAMAKLSNFSETGNFGAFSAGQAQPLGYGDYSATGLESQGQSQLQQLLNGGIPEQYKMGDEALRGFLTTDPSAIQAQFDPFKSQVQRQIGESDKALKRNAGFAGNLYSTDTVRGLGDIQARGNETLTSELARLTNEQANRRLQAVPLAYQSAEAQQGARLQQIAASQQYGALTRQLNDASIKARDAELLRRRQELLLPIDAAKSVLGAQANYGVPTVQNPSPYADLLGLVGQIGGTALGTYLGGPAGGAIGSKVGSSLTQQKQTYQPGSGQPLWR